MASKLPDLLVDTKLDVKLLSSVYSHHIVIKSDPSAGQPARRRVEEKIWRKERKLGEGAYGHIWLERCLTSPGDAQVQAVKVIRKTLVSSLNIDYHHELEAIAKFSQNKYKGLFVESLGWYEDQNAIYIAMEYLECGDLNSCLQGALPELEVKYITTQILEGLLSLHQNGFVHRDLKPANIFVVCKGPKWWVKIGDFGFSKRLGENIGLHSVVGTPLFLAPEVLNMYPPGADIKSLPHYTHTIDLWSLGVTTFYMLCYEYPFKDTNSLWAYVQGAAFPISSKLHEASEESRHFIQSVMAADSSQRISSDQALKHPWLQDPLADSKSSSKQMVYPPPFIPPLSSTGSSSSDPELGGWSTTYPSPETSINERYMRMKLDDQGNQSLPMAKVSTSSPETPSSPVDVDFFKGLYFIGEKRLEDEQYLEAQIAFQQAINGQRNHLGPDHTETLCSIQKFGEALYHQSKFNEALAAFLQASKDREKALGERHQDTLVSRHWLGVTHYQQAEYTEARTHLLQAVQTRGEILGPLNLDTSASNHWLGLVYFQQNAYIDARNHLQQALECRRKILAPQSKETLLSCGWLGLTYYQLSDFEKVYTHFNEILTQSGHKSFPDQTLIFNSYQMVAITLYHLRRYKEARPMLQHIFNHRKDTLGMKNRETILSCSLVGQCLFYIAVQDMSDSRLRLRKHSMESEMLQALKDATRHLRSILDPTHYEIMTTLEFLGRALFLTRKFEEAETAQKEVVCGRMGTLGPGHPNTQASLNQLALSLEKQNKWHGAMEAYKIILAAREEVPGSDGALTRESRQDYERCRAHVMSLNARIRSKLH